jgi:hypothetical protein
VAFFDKVIPPGGEGKIELRIDTKGYQGAILKVASIVTNNPLGIRDTIQVSGIVKPYIALSSKFVELDGAEGQYVSQSVDITAGLEKPLSLEPSDFNLSEKVEYSIAVVEEGKKYRITFKNINGSADRFRGLLKIKTNYPEKPELTIIVKGTILKLRKG